MLYFFHYLSDKQKFLLEKALKRIGFLNDTFRINYLNALQEKYQKIENGNFSRYTEISNLIYNTIVKEYNFKKIINEDDVDEPENHIQALFHNYTTDYVTASDISQYIFCPVSYCIKNHLKMSKTRNQKLD